MRSDGSSVKRNHLDRVSRISTLGASSAVISDHRKTEPAKLSALLKGDLDWIVMKALEKDRTRRYDAAGGLAEDVRRFLKNEPVLARSPSITYRVAKFARRNKAAVTSGLLLTTALLLGVIAVTWMAYLWKTERDCLQTTMEQIKLWAVSEVLTGDDARADRAFQIAVMAGAPEAWQTMMRGQMELVHGNPQFAIGYLKTALDLDPGSVAAKAMLATAYFQSGHQKEYLPLREQLAKAKPIRAEDFLFRALSFSGNGDEDAQRAVELTGSPFAKVVRAEMRCHAAIENSDLGIARLCAQGLRASPGGFSGEPLRSTASTSSHCTSHFSWQGDRKQRMSLTFDERPTRWRPGWRNIRIIRTLTSSGPGITNGSTTKNMPIARGQLWQDHGKLTRSIRTQ